LFFSIRLRESFPDAPAASGRSEFLEGDMLFFFQGPDVLGGPFFFLMLACVFFSVLDLCIVGVFSRFMRFLLSEN